MDDITDQAFDLVWENETLQNKVIAPIKKKAYPIVLCGVAINLLLVLLVIFLTYRVCKIQSLLSASSPV